MTSSILVKTTVLTKDYSKDSYTNTSWFLCFIAKQLKNKKNNAESFRNCAEKA